ncbi:MAG TPA: phosphoribosylformylglycinamidine synthase, partial [Candidatus Omnitrophica bacterium]|nr:phosphoribosylformylglycinamidine synthase [Candidatus Omnitrophota bacterium]
MLTYKIKVSEKEGIFDAVGHGALKDIQDLGIQGVRQVHFALLYYINGDVNQAQITRIAEELLIDKITQEYAISEGRGTRDERRVVEIAYNQGVMDPVEESVLKAISDMGINGVISVRTAKQYYLEGEFSEDTAKIISEKLLYNKVIQHVANRGTKDEGRGAKDEADYKFKLITVDLLSASDKKLREISKQGQLFLNLSEMRQIKNYFKSLGRNPTDCELETIAQTWSEHCRHKTFRGKIEYREVTTSQGHKVTSSKKIINNLLKSTIMKVTKELNKHWCVSVFKDNAGIIKFNDNYNICFKVETHNHPSALEPFGGANTGIGG